MFRINVDTIEGKKTEKLYSISDFPYNKYAHGRVSVKHGKNPVIYLEESAAFDIETTNIKDPDRPWAFMYHWQFCLGKDVVFGRRWEEFAEFLRRLHDALYLADNRRLVVFTHNLSFEWQFMRFYIGDVTEGFFKDERKPLKVSINGFEFRDSYALSNMSLEKFCENTKGVTHYKLVDTYDYSKLRTPRTELTMEEMAYCYNDVRGLCECIDEYRKHDNLANIPLTSTGFVRRDYRKSMNNRRLRESFLASALWAEIYQALKEAFRGGNTHANIYWVGVECRNVHSYDISSSYPFQLMVREYPIGKFFQVKPERMRDYLTGGKYAMLIHAAFKDIEYAGTCGNPYISIAKCKHTEKIVNDNGRVLAADGVVLWLTDIDFKIIERDYKIGRVLVDKVYVSKYGQLPKEFKETLLGYYIGKTQLKGIPEKEYEYMKSKNKLNSSYGMTVTDIAKPDWVYENGEYIKKETDLRERLDKYYSSRNSFLPYQWGVWVTAWARWQLQNMLWKVGEDVIYCDTDSVKYAGDHASEFEAENMELQKLAEQYGAYAEDSKGRIRYMGVWEPDAVYETFKTLGAKKYCFRHPGEKEIYSTIAGVSKKAGRDFFTLHGFQAFENETIIPHSGHLVAYYNDDKPHMVTVDGCTFSTASNTALIDGDYTIGQTAEYLDLLEKALEQKALIMLY